jgi:polar amino acid transport system substrate-binding protein
MRKSFYKITITALTTIVTALAAIAIIISISCSKSGNGKNGVTNAKTFNSLADFSDKKIASEYGSVFAKFIDRIIPNVEHRYYMTFDAIVDALRADVVDAIALDMPVALYLAAHDTDFAVFPYVISVDTYGFAVPKGSRLFEEGNKILRKLKESGVVDDAEMYWFAADSGGEEKSMPPLTHLPKFNGSAGTIRFGCETTLLPMSYAAPDGKAIGFDIDILNRIAYELNMKVEVIQMPFGNLLPALLNGRLDMAGGSMTITEERKEIADFIGPYFEGGTALIVKKSMMPQ